MTLILGVEDPAEGRSFLFADTGIWRKADHAMQSALPKLWRDGDWICGAAGDWELAQAAQRIPFPAFDPEPQPDVDVLIDWQKKVYAESGAVAALIKGVTAGADFSTPSIIAARGALVYDCEDVGVCRSTYGYAGAGYWIYAVAAMSAIHLVAGNLAPFEAGQAAMRASESVTDGIRRPFRWLCTDGTEGEFE